MLVHCLQLPPVTYRNFNLCPHCALNGLQTPLARLREGLPMISRSDGENFHIVLADRPLPYPNERSAGPTRKISVCFWYSHVRHPKTTFSTVITLEGSRMNHPAVFRRIEIVADLLAEELAAHGHLAEFYDVVENPPAWCPGESTTNRRPI